MSQDDGQREGSIFRKAQRGPLHDNLRTVVEAHGLHYFLASFFPEFDRVGLYENLLATNWPQELLAKYKKTNMYRDSRIIAGLKKSILPLCAESLLFAKARDGGMSCELLGYYCDDDFANTLGLSLHDATRRHYLVMFSGSKSLADDDGLGRLILDSMKAIDAFAPMENPAVKLSERELDCLRWSGEGKSSEDIAVILALSPYTVNDHLRTAMRKLGAVSRTQAVAIAYRSKLI